MKKYRITEIFPVNDRFTKTLKNKKVKEKKYARNRDAKSRDSIQSNGWQLDIKCHYAKMSTGLETRGSLPKMARDGQCKKSRKPGIKSNLY